MNQNGSAAMLVTKRPAGVTQEVNLQVRKHESKGSTLALTRSADLTRSPKQRGGVSGPTKRTNNIELHHFQF